MPHLLLIGTASIQDFVFRSNRLRENLGASDLVRFTGLWWRLRDGQDLLRETGGRIVFVGGGNAALIFPDLPASCRAVKVWSARMLQGAPGLRVVVGGATYQHGGLAVAYQQAQNELLLAENRPSLGLELGALSWIRPCPSTGWAASARAA